MKITIDLDKLITALPTFIRRFEVKDSEPVKPPVDKPLPLKNWKWENSNRRGFTGQSYVQVPRGLDIVSVTVKKKNFTNQPSVDNDYRGWNFFYGPNKNTFTGKAQILARSRNNKTYQVVVNLSGGGSQGKTEEGAYHGRHNNDRPTWYFSKKMKAYPRRLRVVIDGCLNREITHNGHRYDSGGLIVKQSDVSGRGMAVVFSSSCKSRTCRIKY